MNVGEPHNITAEQAVLGALLCDNALSAKLFLKPEDFFDPVHRRLAARVIGALTAGAPADAISLAGWASADPGLAALGGRDYLAELMTGACAPAAAVDYAGHLRELSLRRRLMKAASDALEAAESDLEVPARRVAADLETALLELLSGADGQRGPKAWSRVMAETLEAMTQAYEHGGHPDAIPSGLDALDRLLGGALPGWVTVLAARPSMGKSLLALKWALEAAERDRPVLFLSLEQNAAEHGARALGAGAGIEYARALHGDVNEQEFRAIAERARASVDLPVWIDDEGVVSPADYALAVRRFLAERGATAKPMVVIDHGGLMDGEGRSDYERINAVLKAIKQVAQATQVVTLCVAQLSRNVEMRANKRPQLSDLRDSGKWEENAHQIAMLYRDAYYAGREPACEEPLDEDKRLARAVSTDLEISVQKNRNGPTGVGAVFCNVKTGEIRDLASEYEAV